MWHPKLRRLPALLGMLSSLLLVACGDDSQEGRFSAVLHGPVNSPAFDALRGLLTIGDEVASAQVLVVDGDAYSPGALASDAVVQQHLREGKWVLLVDLTKDHNDRDMVPLAHSSGAGQSHIAVLRRRNDAFGRPAIDLYDFPRSGTLAPTEQQLADLPRSVAEFLRKVPAAAPAGFTPPPGLIYVTFNFTQPDDSAQFSATKNGTDTSNGIQNTSVNRGFVYSLFLDNQNTPTGDFQQLLVHDTVQATPLNSALGTDALMITKTGSSLVTCDIGWFQVAVDHTAVAANPGLFTPQDNSPQNTNEQEQVTTGVSFGINFSNPLGSGGGTATYSESVTQNVSQWSVLNPTTGSWSWQNQDPWKYGNTSWDSYGFGGGVKGFGEFRVPNDLARGLLVADTKLLLATASVVNSVQTFTHTTTLTYMNAWADALGPIKHQFVELPLSSSWQINMAAVIPVPIVSLAFSPNPVNAAVANAKAQGTVTLQSPAPMDTIVYLQSNLINATVLPSVTIKQGESSATFQVDVSADNLAPGQSTVATILASNAVAYQAQLTVKNGN